MAYKKKSVKSPHGNNYRGASREIIREVIYERPRFLVITYEGKKELVRVSDIVRVKKDDKSLKFYLRDMDVIKVVVRDSEEDFDKVISFMSGKSDRIKGQVMYLEDMREGLFGRVSNEW